MHESLLSKLLKINVLEHELVFVSRNFLEVLMQEVFCSFLGISRSIFIENKLLHNFWVKKRGVSQ